MGPPRGPWGPSNSAVKATPSYPVPPHGGAVLITGASTGIGFHAASVLAENGFRVYAGVRSQKAKEEVEKLLPGGAWRSGESFNLRG